MGTVSLQLEPPVPVYMKFVFFNVLNPYEVANGGKPEVYEQGPYAYREYRTKQAIVELAGDTLSYDQKITYEFDQE